jgi:acyl carrier protein phosphodiesterase
MLAYQTVDGIELVLDRMSANTSLPDHTEFAVKRLRDQYQDFSADFQEFFPQIVRFIEEKYSINISDQVDRSGDCQAD